MPPKQRITREMILERSFAMFCKEGMEVINARSVAKALNCSTQPIFSYFEGMEDLKNSLDQKAQDTFREMIDARSGQSFMDCVCAYVRFATKQPRLYAHLFLRINGENKDDNYNTQGRQDVVRREAETSDLSYEQAQTVCRSVWVYAHGLAALQAAGWTAYGEDEVRTMLQKAYEHSIADAKA